MRLVQADGRKYNGRQADRCAHNAQDQAGQTECTAAERLESEANYAFFKEAMKKELEIFYSAFANKNNLFPPADKVKPRSIEELSPEEKAYYAKVGLMAEGMERHTLRKAIAAGETE